MLNAVQEKAIDQMIEMLYHLKEHDIQKEPVKKAPTEILTIKECANVVQGVSEHSIRMLVAQGKVKSVRVGEKGKRGKILVNKADLKAYFGS